MGSWGIKSHESDTGLNLLAVAEDRYLQGVEYTTFHIRHITELLRTHIVDKFVKESRGWESDYIDFFYEDTFPVDFAFAVMLVAECFAEYRQTGTYKFYDYKIDSERSINEFIYTGNDLEILRKELQSTLDPKHPLSKSWIGSALGEWQAHIHMLCDTLSEAILEKVGDGDG